MPSFHVFFSFFPFLNTVCFAGQVSREHARSLPSRVAFSSVPNQGRSRVLPAWTRSRSQRRLLKEPNKITPQEKDAPANGSAAGLSAAGPVSPLRFPPPQCQQKSAQQTRFPQIHSQQPNFGLKPRQTQRLREARGGGTPPVDHQLT